MGLSTKSILNMSARELKCEIDLGSRIVNDTQQNHNEYGGRK